MLIKSYFYKETNNFDNKMLKINGIRTTSTYDVIAFYSIQWWKLR